MVRETKKQDRNPEDLISKERGTEVKIKDDVCCSSESFILQGNS